MKRSGIVGAALAATMALTVGATVFAASSTAASSGPVASTFATGKLNTSIWHVISQDSNLSMTSNPGWLTIMTQTLPVATYGTALKDMVLQSANPSANWTVSVETSVFGTSYGPAPGTSTNYQGGGLYAFQDNTDWIRVQRQPFSCDVAVQMDDGTWGTQTGITYANGQALPTGTVTENTLSTSPAFDVACNKADNPLWLRLSKVGDVYTGYYSTNGTHWVALQSFAWSALKPSYVGVTANEGGNTLTPIPFGFKDFTVSTAATTTTSSTSAPAATTSSSTAASSTSATSSSSSSSSSTLPKTGESRLAALGGILLLLVGAAGALALRHRTARL